MRCGHSTLLNSESDKSCLSDFGIPDYSFRDRATVQDVTLFRAELYVVAPRIGEKGIAHDLRHHVTALNIL
jgi:hypothetical protein